MKIMLLIAGVSAVVVCIVGYSLLSKRPAVKTQPLDASDPRYASIARIVADDIVTLRTVDGDSVDSRPNVGGIFFGVTADGAQYDNSVYTVPLVLRTSLPPSAPNHNETATEFFYTLIERGDTFVVSNRPNPDAMRAQYDMHLEAYHTTLIQ